VFVITSAFSFSAFDTLSACRDESTSLRSAWFVNEERERREHDRPGESEPEREPERAAAELTPAASLTRSSSIGDERVVVELRDEQPEAGARDQQRDDQPQPEWARGTIGIRIATPSASRRSRRG
jgi:hypothetical protein